MQTLKLELPRWELLPDIGLYMDQVITLIERAFEGALPKGEITKSMVNNYVKSGLLKRPAGKKYDREHLAMLMEIAVLKQALSMEHIAVMLELLNRDGVREGYERFAREVRALSECAQDGRMQMSGEADERERALHTGVAAAVCTISAGRLLGGISQKEARRLENLSNTGA